MTETANYPDIEIYLKRVAPQDIIEWLKQRFESMSVLKQAGLVTELDVTHENHNIPVLIVEKAQGIYTSVLFESEHTPWQEDRSCAEEAFKQFGAEVRCNASSWEEGAEPDEWLSISDAGEQLINWPG